MRVNGEGRKTTGYPKPKTPFIDPHSLKCHQGHSLHTHTYTYPRTAVQHGALVQRLQALEDLDEVDPDDALVDVLPPLHVAVFVGVVGCFFGGGGLWVCGVCFFDLGVDGGGCVWLWRFT